MIDIESDVFTYVANAVRTSFSSVTVTNEYTETFAKFPAVTIVEADNRVYRPARTANIENAVTVMYQVNVFSDKAAGKKAQAKKIRAVVDAAFAELGFTRTMGNQVPNLRDDRIYRIVCRYEGIAVPEKSGNKTIYRIYQPR